MTIIGYVIDSQAFNVCFKSVLSFRSFFPKSGLNHLVASTGFACVLPPPHRSDNMAQRRRSAPYPLPLS